MISKENYKDYKYVLNVLDIQNLKDRRKKLSLEFVKKKSEKLQNEQSLSPKWHQIPYEEDFFL